MLPNTFLDWWFAPWSYASVLTQRLPLATDELGRRDGYRLWCSEACINPDLPEKFDPAWTIVATSNGLELAATARLFAGLLAAREHTHQVLRALSFADHKWCVSVAATQPLSQHWQINYSADDSNTVRGLVYLACHIEHDFPGLWERLLLTLPIALANRAEYLRLNAVTLTNRSESSVLRTRRCWRLCHNRGQTMPSPTAVRQPIGMPSNISTNISTNMHDDEVVT